MKRSRLSTLLALAVLAALLAPAGAGAAQQQRCFSSENPTITNCIDEPFKSFWEKNGGLAVFGYPLAKVKSEKTAAGTIQVQSFERARLERHRENQPPYDIQLSLLGDALLQLQGRDWRAASRAQAQPGCQVFEATGHMLCEPFLSYYRAHGLQLDANRSSFSMAESQALFGLPLTEPAMERATDGQQYLTQWFERARFELHPENPLANRVLLGRLGAEVLSQQPSPTAGDAASRPPSPPPQPAAASCGAVPPSTNAIITNTCLSDDNRNRTVFSLTGYQPGERLSAWLVDADGITIGIPAERRSRTVCQLEGGTVSLGSVGRCRDWVINDYGNANGVELDGSALYPGYWMLVLQSQKSDRSSRIVVQILPHTLQKGDPCANPPASVDATVNPPCGQRSLPFKLIARGFHPGEAVSYFITAPDGIVEPFTDTYNRPSSADASGNVMLAGLFPATALKGDYSITVAGAASGHKAVGAFRLR